MEKAKLLHTRSRLVRRLGVVRVGRVDGLPVAVHHVGGRLHDPSHPTIKTDIGLNNEVFDILMILLS